MPTTAIMKNGTEHERAMVIGLKVNYPYRIVVWLINYAMFFSYNNLNKNSTGKNIVLEFDEMIERESHGNRNLIRRRDRSWKCIQRLAIMWVHNERWDKTECLMSLRSSATIHCLRRMYVGARVCMFVWISVLTNKFVVCRISFSFSLSFSFTPKAERKKTKYQKTKEEGKKRFIERKSNTLTTWYLHYSIVYYIDFLTW